MCNESPFKLIITDIRINLSKRGHKLIKNGLKYAEEMTDLTYSQGKNFKEKLVKFNNDLIIKKKLRKILMIIMKNIKLKLSKMSNIYLMTFYMKILDVCLMKLMTLNQMRFYPMRLNLRKLNLMKLNIMSLDPMKLNLMRLIILILYPMRLDPMRLNLMKLNFMRLNIMRLDLMRLTISSKEFLDIQATIECGFTLKRVRDMIRTYRLLFSFVFLFSFKILGSKFLILIKSL